MDLEPFSSYGLEEEEEEDSIDVEALDEFDTEELAQLELLEEYQKNLIDQTPETANEDLDIGGVGGGGGTEDAEGLLDTVEDL